MGGEPLNTLPARESFSDETVYAGLKQQGSTNVHSSGEKTKLRANESHIQRFYRQTGVQAVREGIPDHRPGERIEDHCQIDKARPDADVSQVSHPGLVGGRDRDMAE